MNPINQIIAAEDYADLPDSMRNARRWLLWRPSQNQT